MAPERPTGVTIISVISAILGALLVLWLGSRDVMQGRLTVGEFVAFNAYLAMLTWPMIA